MPGRSGAERPVAGVADAGDDVAVVVESLVDADGEAFPRADILTVRDRKSVV